MKWSSIDCLALNLCIKFANVSCQYKSDSTTELEKIFT